MSKGQRNQAQRSRVSVMNDNCLPIYVDIAAQVRYDVGYQITGGAKNASELYL